MLFNIVFFQYIYQGDEKVHEKWSSLFYQFLEIQFFCLGIFLTFHTLFL